MFVNIKEFGTAAQNVHLLSSFIVYLLISNGLALKLLASVLLKVENLTRVHRFASLSLNVYKYSVLTCTLALSLNF